MREIPFVRIGDVSTKGAEGNWKQTISARHNRAETRRTGRFIAMAAALVLLTATGAAFLPTPSTPSNAGEVREDAIVSDCTSNHVEVSRGVGFGNAAGGTNAYPLIFTNIGTTTCSLLGFPRVSFVDSRGLQIAIASPISKGDMIVTVPRGTILSRRTLAPGHSVIAIVVYYEGAGNSCTNALTVSSFRVHLSSQSSSFVVPVHAFMCFHAPRTALVVYPFGVGRLLQ
jgi:hypothetical protein